MGIDIIFAVIMAFAIYKGYSRGLIVAIFSFLAIILGIAAAMKLGAAVATYLQAQSGMPSRWWPIVAFLVIFIAIAIIIRIGATLLERVVELGLMGWVNKLGGILLYGALYTIVFSVLLWWANQLYWLSPDTKLQSVVYPYIEPIGPFVINSLGKVLPIFRDMFDAIQEFFEQLAHKIPS
ncbi:colicin V production protein [Chitinophaga caeni]|uniref:Colicin V production protein n=1 Tax=Chitinophaga caeni TaxID=2029983 RepID=A0A291QQQ7_9BACT|nr:CvpA family protein [Chitinophaga caeni]ATL46290.1 colicin V production protein [Chitinophaga caeni]